MLSGRCHCVLIVRIRSYSGPHFPAFGINTERYSVSPRSRSECGKMRTRITSNTDTFYAVKPFGILDNEIKYSFFTTFMKTHCLHQSNISFSFFDLVISNSYLLLQVDETLSTIYYYEVSRISNIYHVTLFFAPIFILDTIIKCNCSSNTD